MTARNVGPIAVGPVAVGPSAVEPSAAAPIAVILTADGIEPPRDLTEFAAATELRLATAETLPQALVGAEILLVWDIFSNALHGAWDSSDCLRWIHVAAAGVDAVLFDELRESEVVVTNAQGIFDGPIAEYVLACVLAHDKRLYETDKLQRARTWKHRETTQVRGRRALVVGTGGIGREIARLLTAVGMSVMGAGRTAREGDPDFGTVVRSADYAKHLGEIDHLIMVAPLTPETHRMLDATTLAALPDGAHVINVGRGLLIDQAALTAELISGRIAASLDVVETEPLPADDPLWGLSNVHLSPHMSGDVVGWRDALSAQFADKLHEYLRGSLPGPVVDKYRGYVSVSPDSH